MTKTLDGDIYSVSRNGTPRVLVSLRVAAAAGAILFGAAFVVALVRPAAIETRAHDFIVRKVSARVSQIVASHDTVAGTGMFAELSARLHARAESLRARLDAGLSVQVAAFLTSVCYYCPPSDSLEAKITATAESQIGLLQTASATAMSWARHRYTEAITALIRDLRIFHGSECSSVCVDSGCLIVSTSSGQAGLEPSMRPRLSSPLPPARNSASPRTNSAVGWGATAVVVVAGWQQRRRQAQWGEPGFAANVHSPPSQLQLPRPNY
jgi:hypothetical protein